MTVAAPRKRWTIQEYYRLENDASERHEFDDGEILAMSGGSATHALIMANVSAELHQRLRGRPCRPYSSDLRVRVAGHPRVVYPDVTVIRGKPETDPDDPAGHAVLNPRVVVEVMSPSTRTYDRTVKFDAYRRIESLQEYILVEQDEPRVESFLRQEDGAWSFESAAGTDAVLRVRSLELELPLAELYAGVTFATSA